MLRRCPVQAVGGELEKRRDGGRAGGGNELEPFQKMVQPLAISATVVCHQMDVGWALTIPATAAANRLHELICARSRRQNQRNFGRQREALIQFRPPRHLLVREEKHLGLTGRVKRLIVWASEFDSLAAFVYSVGAIHEPSHFLVIFRGDCGSFPGEGRNGLAILRKRPDE